MYKKANLQCFFAILFSILIISELKSLKNENTAPPLVRLVVPPSAYGDKFSSKCKSPEVKGFVLSAKCRNSRNVERNASVSFNKCLKNYDGNIEQFNGQENELYTKNCKLGRNKRSIECSCQQMHGGFKPCSAKIDEFFRVKNGKLNC